MAVTRAIPTSTSTSPTPVRARCNRTSPRSREACHHRRAPRTVTVVDSHPMPIEGPSTSVAVGAFPPEFLARFRIHSVLGTGTSGSVLLATQLDLDRPAAVKCLHRLEPQLLARFRREAELTAALSHPNIVRLYTCD